jgi:hypothetical protein
MSGIERAKEKNFRSTLAKLKAKHLGGPNSEASADAAIAAFLLWVLEIHKEQQARKSKMH